MGLQSLRHATGLALWGFGHFFPANTIAAHVTDMGKRPPKLACDVALSGAFGVDRDVSKMSAEERKTIVASIALYKNRLRDLVAQGDLYRLESPYKHPRAALDYVSADRTRAVLFIYQLSESAFGPIKPRGLDPTKRIAYLKSIFPKTPSRASTSTTKSLTARRS